MAGLTTAPTNRFNLLENFTGEDDDNTEMHAVTGGGSDSATGRASGESHRVGGDWAEGRSEANRVGYQPQRGGPSRRANEEGLDATPDAVRVPGGTNNIGVSTQHARGAENQQHPTPRGGSPRGRDARGVGALQQEHQASQNGSPFLQPIAPQTPNGHIPNPRPTPQPPQPNAQTRPAGNHPHARVYPGSAPPHRRHTTGKKNTKASIKVGALNMKGRGKPEDDKWFHIWQVMREQKAGVLIVTETHLDDEHKNNVDTLFKRAMRLEFTPDPEAPTARAGLAFALNRNTVEADNVSTTVIIPGRAMILKMKNVDGSNLSILGIYAPNRPYLNAAFWRDIKAWYIAHQNTDRPDVLGGDFNFVEDGIDRLPTHPDSKASVDAFDELKMYLGLMDGWRETYPTTCAYTFMQAPSQGGSQSRIDRIYIKRDLFENSFEWEMQAVGIETDHRMVTMRLTTEDAPTIGHGRWVWPAHIIRDKALAKTIHDDGLTLQNELAAIAQKELNGQWNPRHNAQTLWVDFTTKMCAEARTRAKITVPQIVEEIAEIKNKIDLIENDKDLLEDEIMSGF
ncbi:Endonuclease/exonuclease/phosphatase [Mycena pura]|uniref:Endonuclease/exonuclease/phosphatase n=1 Tax=Mycena pura TaxID=153505 RepID=A0AAD6V6A7_9AGAR|nr:Endonuclease/exonuclease/phosphatase [Mycena pura]